MQERHNEIEAQAIRWLVRLDAGQTPDAVAGHEAWLARNVRHKVAYAKHAIAWKRMDLLRRMRPLDRNRADPDLLRPKRRWLGVEWGVAAFSWATQRAAPLTGALSRAAQRVTRRGTREDNEYLPAWLPKAVAATVVLGLIVGVVRFLHDTDAGAVYYTRVGQTQHVVLSDGTELDLNTNTRVRIRFTAAKRHILLERGEVMLSVAHDASRPLEVLAGAITARAVGTKFSVRLHEDARVETLVTEGRVLVLRQESLLGIPLAQTPISHTLVAGEKVIADRRSAAASKATPKEVQRKLMWTTGRVAFEGETLADVVEELNRYTLRKLEIRDPGIAGKSVGGGFDTANAEAYSAELSRFFTDDALPLVTPMAAAAEKR